MFANLSYLTNWMWLVWIIAFALFLIVEAYTSELTSVWLSAGSLFAFAAARIGFGALWQIVVFAVVSVLFIVLLKPMVKRYVNVKKTATNVDSVIGSVGVVTEDISVLRKGQVKLANGRIWMAVGEKGEEIGSDVSVVVKKVEGVTLTVSKSKNSSEQQEKP